MTADLEYIDEPVAKCLLAVGSDLQFKIDWFVSCVTRVTPLENKNGKRQNGVSHAINYLLLSIFCFIKLYMKNDFSFSFNNIDQLFLTMKTLKFLLFISWRVVNDDWIFYLSNKLQNLAGPKVCGPDFVFSKFLLLSTCFPSR